MTLNPPKNDLDPVILACKFVLGFSPIYVTTKQKADICSSFQVIVWRDTQTYTPVPNAWYVHVFMITVRQSSGMWKTRDASDRHTQCYRWIMQQEVTDGLLPSGPAEVHCATASLVTAQPAAHWLHHWPWYVTVT